MRQGKQDSGQAIVEYVVTLMMALLILSIVTAGFNASLRKTWKKLAFQIAAGCPNCPSR
jgi:Tfp pilus assembly protein PilW